MSVMLITEGKVDLCIKMKTTNKEEVFDTLKQGSIIGELWGITEQNYTFTARAKTDVTIHYLPTELIKTLKLTCLDLDYALSITQEEIVLANSFGGI